MEVLNKLDNDGLNIEMHENIFQSPDNIFERLEKEIEYLPRDKTHIYIKGKLCKIARQIAAYGDSGLSYTFSGLNVPCEPWISSVLEIKNKVDQICGCLFNFVLINRYKDGNDSIGQHKDSECDLKEGYPIASVSFGEKRKMIFKRPNFKDTSVELKNNSLLVMKAPTNTLWSHGIPREVEKKGVRISLTFRNVVVRCKRKSGEPTEETNKKMKEAYDNSQSCGFFSLNDVPEGIYSIGGDLFLTRNTYRRKSLTHVRRYKKYGQVLYPTKEGITMDIHEFDTLMRSPIPEHLGQLFEIDDHLGYALDISVFSGDQFKLSKRYNRPNSQETITSVVISTEQWQKMKSYHDLIMEQLINDWISTTTFKDMFVIECKENELQKSLPDSWDVTVGTTHVTNILQTVIIDLLTQKGNLFMPERDIGVILSSNDIKDFNTTVKDLNMYEVMQNFYAKVSAENEDNDFFVRKIMDYVTIDFLNSIDFPYLISEVRRKLCPAIGMTSHCV